MQILRIYKILLFFCIFNYANASALFEPKFPDEVEILLMPKEYKLFTHYIDQARDPIHPNIDDKYKKKIKAQIKYKLMDSNIWDSGSIRLTGDWKDHIDKNKYISSLKIDLKKINIGGIVSFRLLLPHTRKGSNEILWSSLIEELGFPVPHRRFINVNFNGTKYKAIFEESPEKEFIERFAYRESPIVESDERQMWNLRANNCLEENGACNHEQTPIGPESLKIDNAKFNKNKVSSLISLKAISSSEEFVRTLEPSYKLLNSKYANHGLITHNLKLLYDPIYDDFRNIYFDGDVDFNSKDKIRICDHKKVENNWTRVSDNTKAKYITVLRKFKNRSGNEINKSQECAVKDSLMLFQESNGSLKVKMMEPNNGHIKHRSNKHYFPLPSMKQIRSNVIGLDETDLKLKRCKVFTDGVSKKSCKELDLKKQKKELGGNGKPIKHDVYKVFPIIIGMLDNKEHSLGNIEKIELPVSQNDLHIPSNTTIFLKVQEDHTLLNTYHEDSLSSKLVIYQSKLGKDFQLNSFLPEARANLNIESRYDARLLTSCVTFLDSYFSGGKIKVTGGSCEDSLNFLRSNGEIDQIKVYGAYSDAIDSDFSQLDIKDVFVNSAGNDCLDLSAGYYNLKKINLTNCGDKAVSIGERSRAVISDALIKDADIGFSSKDSSRTFIHKTDLNNISQNCFEAYKKKQEYDGGELYITESKCKSSKKDIFSKISSENNNICKKVSYSNGVEFCLKHKGLDFSIQENRSPDSKFIVTRKNRSLNDKPISQILLISKECNRLKNCEFSLIWDENPTDLIVQEFYIPGNLELFKHEILKGD